MEVEDGFAVELGGWCVACEHRRGAGERALDVSAVVGPAGPLHCAWNTTITLSSGFIHLTETTESFRAECLMRSHHSAPQGVVGPPVTERVGPASLPMP